MNGTERNRLSIEAAEATRDGLLSSKDTQTLTQWRRACFEATTSGYNNPQASIALRAIDDEIRSRAQDKQQRRSLRWNVATFWTALILGILGLLLAFYAWRYPVK